MSFINENFLLYSKTAQHLYHDYAENLPIIDYHCHLSPEMIATDYPFGSIGELMLGGDHYKWRLMRSNGTDEYYITGSAPYEEKFREFSNCLTYAIGNPMLHWTQLELKRYFGIDDILNEQTYKKIWDITQQTITKEKTSAKKLIAKSNVEIICTTDDPTDDLSFHKKINSDNNFKTKVYPTFRPDKLLAIEKDDFGDYIINTGIKSYSELLSYIKDRIKYFDINGCRVSDHSFEIVPFSTGNAKDIFDKKINGASLTFQEIEAYKTAIMTECAAEYAKHGWAMQLHIGAMRNNNSKMFNSLGADSGFDSINDLNIAQKLSAFLNHLNQNDILPKTILYTLNPKDNYVLASMLGNFQNSSTPGKMQFGSAWWFNDQKDGMESQLKALANLGLLGHFVGMLTDSRSFISYPRHEYFRRILCNLIGKWVDDGLYPHDEHSLKTIIEGICYNNAKKYFNFK